MPNAPNGSMLHDIPSGGGGLLCAAAMGAFDSMQGKIKALLKMKDWPQAERRAALDLVFGKADRMRLPIPMRWAIAGELLRDDPDAFWEKLPASAADLHYLDAIHQKKSDRIEAMALEDARKGDHHGIKASVGCLGKDPVIAAERASRFLDALFSMGKERTREEGVNSIDSFSRSLRSVEKLAMAAGGLSQERLGQGVESVLRVLGNVSEREGLGMAGGAAGSALAWMFAQLPAPSQGQQGASVWREIGQVGMKSPLPSKSALEGIPPLLAAATQIMSSTPAEIRMELKQGELGQIGGALAFLLCGPIGSQSTKRKTAMSGDARRALVDATVLLASHFEEPDWESFAAAGVERMRLPSTNSPGLTDRQMKADFLAVLLEGLALNGSASPSKYRAFGRIVSEIASWPEAAEGAAKAEAALISLKSTEPAPRGSSWMGRRL